MIYADTSFLFSLYAWDDNTQRAQATYASDRRRPLIFNQWQRFELRNAVRLGAHVYRRRRRAVPFQIGNVFRRIDGDLADGFLRHTDTNWLEAFQRAEELSDGHAEQLGCASVDLFHVACAILAGADTFWSFDADQQTLAKAAAKFRKVPAL